MKKKPPVPLSRKFPNADPLALRLLERLLAFDPDDRPSAKEVGSSERPFLIIFAFAELHHLNVLLCRH